MTRNALYLPCQGCANTDFCKRHGCIAWNTDARRRYDKLKRQVKEDNDFMDKLERLIVGGERIL